MTVVKTVRLKYRNTGRGADGDEPNRIVVLGSNIVRSRGERAAEAALLASSEAGRT